MAWLCTITSRRMSQMRMRESSPGPRGDDVEAGVPLLAREHDSDAGQSLTAHSSGHDSKISGAPRENSEARKGDTLGLVLVLVSPLLFLDTSSQH